MVREEYTEGFTLFSSLLPSELSIRKLISSAFEIVDQFRGKTKIQHSIKKAFLFTSDETPRFLFNLRGSVRW